MQRCEHILPKESVEAQRLVRDALVADGVQAAECMGTRNRVTTIDHVHLDRAIVEDATAGFTEIITDHRGRLLGATIVGPRAGETIGEVALAIANGLTATHITNTMHAYPTFNDGVWNACVEITRAGLGRGFKKAGLRTLAAIQQFRIRSKHHT